MQKEPPQTHVMSQDNPLQQVCASWLQAALSFLRSQPYLPGYDDIEVTFNPDGKGFSTKATDKKIDSAHLPIHYREQLFRLPEFEAVIAIVANSPTLVPALFPSASGQAPLELEQQRRMLEGYLGTFLSQYIRAHQDLAFVLADYARIFQKFEAYIYGTEKITTTTLVPIRNLRCEAERVTLAKQVFLRQATYEERKEAVRGRHFVFPPRHDFPETMLCIQHQVAPKETLSVEQQREIHDIANAVVFALRLMKPEDVELDAIYFALSDQPFRNSDGVASSLIHKDFFTDLFVLHAAQDADILTKLWRKAKKAYSKPELLRARTRYEGAYLRRSLEDMLIDFWIGLEALFLPPNYAREMAEAIALAVSYYLGQTDSNRNTIYHAVIDSHMLRGRVVHGRQVDGARLKEMTFKTGELLRRSLRKRIEE